MMKIELFGTGCAKCKLTEKRIKEAIEELDRKDVELLKVEDIEEIVNRGVMATPAVAVDGTLKIVGRIPSKEEIKELIKG